MSKNRDLGNYGSAALLDAHSEVVANTVVQRTANGDINANNVNASTITGTLSGSATSLATARTITLGGDLSGSASFDGTANVTITATVADDSHNHIIGNVDGLQDALDAKVDIVQGKGLSTEDYTTNEKNKLAAIEAGAEVNTVDSVAGRTGAVVLAKADVGLGNVDNTSDANKPVSSATQTALDLKANLASPTLTGTPAAPTANAGTNTTQIATTAFVQTAVAGIVDTAPETLDTLNELAAALGDDPNFATTVSNSIGGKAPLTGEGTSGTWGISITGNANTVTNGVYTSGDQTIAGVKTFSNNAIFNGNVGVGTNSPTSVNGYIAQTINGSSGSFTEYQENNGNTFRVGSDTAIGGFLFTQSALPIRFGTTSTERVRISNTGNVGIGTSNPEARIDFGGSVNQSIYLYNSNSDRYGIDMKQYDDQGYGTNLFSGNGGFIKFRTASGSSVPETRMTINQYGNVGIGTTSPQAKLQVIQGLSSTVPAFSIGEMPGNTRFGIYQEANYSGIVLNDSNIDLKLKSFSAGGSGGAISFWTGTTTATERMKITLDGNVGIGTSSPLALLQLGAKTVENTSNNSKLILSHGATAEAPSSGNPSNVPSVGIEFNRYWYGGSDSDRNMGGIYAYGIENWASGIYVSTRPVGSGGAPITRLIINHLGHVLPGTNATQDLGSSTLRWNTVYTSDLSLKNDHGDWTIVEGEDDLFLYNNKKGKVYKFALTEVDPSIAPAKRD